MKTKILFLIIYVFVSCNFHIFCQGVFEDFYRFKTELYNAEKGKTGSLIKDYKEKAALLTLNEEDGLALNNLILLEEITFLHRGSGSVKKTVFRLLKNQNDLCAAFMKGKKNKQAGKWFLLSWADVKSRLSEFLSSEELYIEAGNTKALYAQALRKDKRFSPANLSYGLWLFFAPPVAGGGYENALAEMTKAVENSKNNYEKYLALVYRSQVNAAMEYLKEGEKDLQEAAKLIPDEIFTQIVREINKNGNIFFE